MRVGFVGIGAMGKPMASNLLKAGYEVHVFDLAEANVNEMAAKGAIPCKTNTELAASVDVVFTSLPNSAIVESVMNGPNGVFDACKPETILIDMSSVSPASTKRMAKIAESKGLHYVDAPVSGGTAGAAAGTLTIMVGADDETFERIKPILNVIGKNIYHVGETGLGDAIKIVNNLLLGCNMAALAEALVLGAKCGLKPEVMQEIISVSSGNSYALTAKLEKFILEGNFDGGFSMNLQHKDLGLALEAAKEVGMPLPVTGLATSIYEMGKAQGLGTADMSAVIKVWESMTGIEVRK